MSDTFKFTDDNFDSSVQTGVALVDLYADWCGPCKIMSPTIDKVAAHYAGKARVGKLNVDDNQLVAGKLGVTAIPTVVIFKGGKEVARMQGVQKEDALKSAIDAHL